MNAKIVVAGFLAALVSIAAPTMAFAQQAPQISGEKNALPSGPPDATLDFKGEQFRLLLGGGSATGVLHYQGKDYPLTAKGGSVGGIGVTEVEGTGKVYYLTKIEDFPGLYSGATMGAALVKGAGTSSWQNNKGVVLVINGKQSGAALNLGIASWDIKLAK
ncbi:exported hypothetical protein [Burkholderiales bacterium]|nr:exported hypothetical protein [Burkholderiales bacterium]